MIDVQRVLCVGSTEYSATNGISIRLRSILTPVNEVGTVTRLWNGCSKRLGSIPGRAGGLSILLIVETGCIIQPASCSVDTVDFSRGMKRL